MLPALAYAQERPNILYIMTDQQGAEAMSCAGNPDLHTPNMDLLASRNCHIFCLYLSCLSLLRKMIIHLRS